MCIRDRHCAAPLRRAGGSRASDAEPGAARREFHHRRDAAGGWGGDDSQRLICFSPVLPVYGLSALLAAACRSLLMELLATTTVEDMKAKMMTRIIESYRERVQRRYRQTEHEAQQTAE